MNNAVRRALYLVVIARSRDNELGRRSHRDNACFFFSFHLFPRETCGCGCGAVTNTRASTISAGSPKDGEENGQRKRRKQRRDREDACKKKRRRIFTLTSVSFARADAQNAVTCFKRLLHHRYQPVDKKKKRKKKKEKERKRRMKKRKQRRKKRCGKNER